MSIIPRYILIPLRIGQVAFGAIVAGIIGYFISLLDDAIASAALGCWIFVEVLACLSVLLALLFLIPRFLDFIVWPIDVVISLAWFSAFGLVLYALDGFVCGPGISGTSSYCATWDAGEAFAFLSAFTWLVTGLMGLYLIWRADESERALENKAYDV